VGRADRSGPATSQIDLERRSTGLGRIGDEAGLTVDDLEAVGGGQVDVLVGPQSGQIALGRLLSRATSRSICLAECVPPA
jgi:hypothetical protein